MKFDPFTWEEVNHEKPIQVRKGRLQVRLSKEGAVFVSVLGYQALVGVGTSFAFEVSDDAEIVIEAPKAARAFIAGGSLRPDTSARHVGEVFTNADRMPYESGSMAEVLRARRMFEMEQRAALRTIRQERKRLEDLANPKPAPAPSPDPAPAPAPDPAPAPAPEAAP